MACIPRPDDRVHCTCSHHLNIRTFYQTPLMNPQAILSSNFLDPWQQQYIIPCTDKFQDSRCIPQAHARCDGMEPP